MLINNAVITGSFIVNGVSVTGITGSSELSSSYLALSSSYLVTSASYAVTSASYAQSSASLSIRTGNLEATSSTLVSASSSFAAQSASLSTRLTTDESNFTSLSSSFVTTSGSISSRVTTIEGQYATTGSNTFTGPQFVNQASNAISFTSTASLYTDGGLRVAKDSFVSGTAYFNNITVYGTSSIEYITSSQVNIGSNVITVNTDTPAIRFGGLSVFDSGSTGLTGSLFWDSEKNHWIYSNPSGSSYNSAMLMNGPRNTGSLGTEQGTLSNYVMKGQGGDHITSSQMIDDGTTVSIPGNLQVTGSLVNTGAATFSSSVTAISSNFTTTSNTYTTQGTISWNDVRGIIIRAKTASVFDFAIYSAAEASMIVNPTGTNNVAFPNGNLLLGTTTDPGYGRTTASIYNSTGGILQIAGSSTTALFYVYQPDNIAVIGTTTNHSFAIHTNATQRLLISNTGAATFSSSVTAGGKFEASFSNTNTSFDNSSYLRLVNTGTSTLNQRVDLIMRWADGTYNGTGGISMVRESATARSGKLVLQPIASDGNNIEALALSSTGAATFSAIDASGNRTNPFDTLTIITTNPSAPYEKFGGSILFKNSSYVTGIVSSARIRSVIYDGGGSEGGGLTFETTPTAGGTLAPTMTLYYTGNVGIKTVLPKTILDIEMVTNATTKIRNTTFGSKGIVFLSGLGDTTNSEIGFFGGNAYESLSAGIGIAREDSGNWGTQLRFYTHITATSGIPADITEKMRITGDGNVGIGTTSPLSLLQVGSIGNATVRLGTSSTTNTSSTYSFVAWTSSGNDILGARGDGLVYAPFIYSTFTTGAAANMGIDSAGGFYRSVSSIKYKKNVENYTKGLAEVMQIRPVFYNSINEKEDGILYAGLIAEEVHELGLTEFVQYAKDGTPDALAYQNMIALAFKAIQELSAKVDAQAAEINELKNK